MEPNTETWLWPNTTQKYINLSSDQVARQLVFNRKIKSHSHIKTERQIANEIYLLGYLFIMDELNIKINKIKNEKVTETKDICTEHVINIGLQLFNR